jgi:hypothetical protein
MFYLSQSEISFHIIMGYLILESELVKQSIFSSNIVFFFFYRLLCGFQHHHPQFFLKEFTCFTKPTRPSHIVLLIFTL